jgi:hypothetical protein
LLIAGLQSAVLVVFHELFPVRMEKGAHLDVSVVCLVTALASIFVPPSFHLLSFFQVGTGILQMFVDFRPWFMGTVCLQVLFLGDNSVLNLQNPIS